MSNQGHAEYFSMFPRRIEGKESSKGISVIVYLQELQIMDLRVQQKISSYNPIFIYTVYIYILRPFGKDKHK